MPNYIRNQVYGGTYFFTVVTKNRVKFFQIHENAETLLKAIKRVQKRKPFEMLAYCILPDHFHILLSLPVDDKTFSQKIREIKRLTTYALRKSCGDPDLIVWQERFWEHTIRDENDWSNCFNYIHFNPVHHELVELPEQWRWSSYHDYYDVQSENKPRLESVKFDRAKNIYGE